MNEEAEGIIVGGGGPFGTAAAGAFSSFSIPFLLLERADCFASLLQRQAYDRLHIHLPKHTCQLPHMPIPAEWPKYPPKSLFVQYLQHYVSSSPTPASTRSTTGRSSPTATGTTMLWGSARGGQGRVGQRKGGGGGVQPRFLMVATGESCDAFAPEVEGLRSFGGKAMRSTEYKKGEEFAKKRVLVVRAESSQP